MRSTPHKHSQPSSAGRLMCNTLVVLAWFLIFGYGSFLVYLYHSNVHLGAGPQPSQTTPKASGPGKVATAAGAAASASSSRLGQGRGKRDAPKRDGLSAEQALLAKLRAVNAEAEAEAEADAASSSSSSASAPEEGSIHVAFSTDCSFYQDWQTLLIFYTATVVGQRGPITRIASGCPEDKQASLTALYKTMYPSRPEFSVHFTPDFKLDPKTKQKYDFYNKPYGVQHWLKHAQPPVPPGVVVAIIDPDMIFLRPLTTRVAGQANNLFMKRYDPRVDPPPPHVARGHPVAQLYGLGAPWAVDRHRNFNRTHICGAGSPCLKTVPRYGEMHFSVGPPYLVERDDLERLTHSWVAMVPKVYERYPELLAEMYAYSMAAAHQQLPHLTLTHYMVSNTEAQDEGWPWVDALGDKVCEPPAESGAARGVYYPDKPLPVMLHYCQFFRVGEFGFQKRRVPRRIFECSGALMADLPRNLALTRYKNRDGEIIPIGQTYARRNAFMLCGIHGSLNAMLRDFKAKMCAGQAVNLNTTVNLAKALHW